MYSSQQNNRFNTIFVVPTCAYDFAVLAEYRKTEAEAFENSSVAALIFIYFNAFEEAVHKYLFLFVGHFIIEFIEMQEIFVNSSQPK